MKRVSILSNFQNVKLLAPIVFIFEINRSLGIEMCTLTAKKFEVDICLTLNILTQNLLRRLAV